MLLMLVLLIVGIVLSQNFHIIGRMHAANPCMYCEAMKFLLVLLGTTNVVLCFREDNPDRVTVPSCVDRCHVGILADGQSLRCMPLLVWIVETVWSRDLVG